MRNAILYFLILLYSVPLFASVITKTDGTDAKVRLNVTGADISDMYVLSSPNSDGISYNKFNNFDVTSKLKVLLDDTPESKNIKLVIIDAQTVKLSAPVELVAPKSVPVIIINSVASSTIECNYCSFTNFSRVSIVAGNAKTENFSKKELIIDTFETNGAVQVSGVRPSDAAAIELYARNIFLRNDVDLNIRANADPRGGFILNPQGSLLVAGAGLNFFTGQLRINYTNNHVLDIKLATKDSSGNFEAFNIDKKIQTSAISITSSQVIQIGQNAILTTKADMYQSSSLNDELFVPVEGVSITAVGSEDKNVSVINQGKILSNNTVGIVATGNLLNLGVISSKSLSVAAKNLFKNTSLIEVSAALDISSRYFDNQSTISSRNVKVITEKTLQNRFGGQVNGYDIYLESGDALINGSRDNATSDVSDVTALKLSQTFDLNGNYGVFNTNKIGTVNKDLLGRRTSISGTNITLVGKYVENINPYYETRLTPQVWDGYVDLDYKKSRAVQIVAQRKLQISGPLYVLNSSAILGLDQTGEFAINTDSFVNERYRFDSSGYVYAMNSSSSDGLVRDSFGNLIQAHVDAISPMGVLYSYGKFYLSPRSESAKTELHNTMSFAQFADESNFYNASIHSLAVVTGLGNKGRQDYSCLINNCSLSTFPDNYIQTTFTSFLGDVYGISSELYVEKSVQLDVYTQSLINRYIAEYKEKYPAAEDETIETVVKDVSSGTVLIDKQLIITRTQCRSEYNKNYKEIVDFCIKRDKKIYLSEIYSLYTSNSLIPGTSHTDAQLRRLVQIYLYKDNQNDPNYVCNESGDNRCDNLDYGFTSVNGYWVSRFLSYNLQKLPEVTVNYDRRYYSEPSIYGATYNTMVNNLTQLNQFVSIPYAAISSYKPSSIQKFDISHSSTSGKLSVSVDSALPFDKYQIQITESNGNSISSVSNTNSALIDFPKSDDIRVKVMGCYSYPTQNGGSGEICSDWSQTKSLRTNYTKPPVTTCPRCGNP